ncbi:MAG: DUF2817 domain-containing protein [Alphaproteobacteria bacterium]|nr:DUF2817 domain-containing protein [Alphaproteobacteria bacterium]
MTPPPDKPKSTWTDGGPTDGGPQDKSFAYRQSRKAFIAACQRCGADVIGRVHPAKGPDGLPLFLDAAAFGPRLAAAGVLVVAYGAPGAAVLQALLAAGTVKRLPEDLRLVLVHGADPAAFAFNDAGHSDPAWEKKMLTAVLNEDLRAAKKLALVGLGGAPELTAPAGAKLSRSTITPGGRAKAAVEAVIQTV